MIENIVLIGAGNLATQLALALHEKNIAIRQIYSRTIESAEELAQKVKAPFTTELSELITDADLYVIAVKDSAIQEVLENLPLDENRLIVHTAGSVDMQVLEDFTQNFGVFYPLQTFSKNRKVDFSSIPICIEANHPWSLVKLQNLAGRLSDTIRQINSDERKILHLAAVFSNNFVNHFYAIGAELLHDRKMSFDLLKPLINETSAKIATLHPREAQTGPAKRNDQSVIQTQLKMLHDQPEYQKIYSFVSDSIFQLHQKHEHDLL
ncbi:MAG: DUF2520 domain-containing protein [Prolixibacteraceae bacterium]|jgi:predicted short-subunit dehydrogenase-like oxidoreductase (DUF2520 family)